MAAKVRNFVNCRQLTANISFLRGHSKLINSGRLASTTSHPRGAHSQDDKTHFGYQTVKEDEKEEKVHEVFASVAKNYDRMNDAMSVGIHRLWKDYFMQTLGPTPGTQLLDVAGGTGDIAFRFLKYVEQETQSFEESQFDVRIPKEYLKTDTIFGQTDEPTLDSDNGNPLKSHVTVCDINQAMLDVGKERAEHMGLTTGISWLRSNAENLSLEDDSFDAYTIAFGIRNVTHIDKALDEAYRVLKPGGRFLCLEFSHVANPLLRWLYDEYSFQVIPPMGKIISGDWKSYQYLVESIRNFPKQDEFAEMIKDAGFHAVTYNNLTFGVAAIHSGFKL